MLLILLGSLLFGLLLMVVATVSSSIKASRVLLILALPVLLANQYWFCLILGIAGALKLAPPLIAISVLVYGGWATLILRKQKKLSRNS